MRILPLFRSFFFLFFFLYPSSRFLFEPSIDGQREGERVEQEAQLRNNASAVLITTVAIYYSIVGEYSSLTRWNISIDAIHKS